MTPDFLPFAIEEMSPARFMRQLESFRQGEMETLRTKRTYTFPNGQWLGVPVFENRFWSRRQRAGSSLHGVAYRDSFSPLLARFFIEHLSRPEELVYDPFMGRGTTPLEAALLGRFPIGNDSNPLSAMVVEPRLLPPSPSEVRTRLLSIDLTNWDELPEQFRWLFQVETLREICALRLYLVYREKSGYMDAVDRWIRMLALTRLTGHTSGYLSIPVGPPNQSVPLKPPKSRGRRCWLAAKSLVDCLMAQSAALTRDWDNTVRSVTEPCAWQARFWTCPAHATPQIPVNWVSLIMTGPPGLSTPAFWRENRVRSWFAGLDPFFTPPSIAEFMWSWQQDMGKVFAELFRVLKPGGYAVFEVTSLRPKDICWDEIMFKLGVAAGLQPVAIVRNVADAAVDRALIQPLPQRLEAKFDKVVVFQKPGPNWGSCSPSLERELSELMSGTHVASAEADQPPTLDHERSLKGLPTLDDLGISPTAEVSHPAPSSPSSVVTAPAEIVRA